MKSILPANTINMQILGMLKLVWLSKLLVVLFLVDININLVNANVSNHDNSYCGWIKSAALAIAQNKVNGFDEYKLIGKVLETNMDYKQQLVIIPMIDRIFQVNDLTPEENAWLEHHICEYTTTYN